MPRKQTILIFEGTEGAGKTAIAKELAKMLNVPYYKDSYQGQLSPIIKQLWDYLKQTGQSVIIDRDFPSYWVYANYYNSPIDDKAVYEMDAVAASLNAKIILCFKDKFREYSDVVPIEANKKLKDLYIEFSGITNCKYLFLDTNEENLKNELKAIVVWLLEQEKK